MNDFEYRLYFDNNSAKQEQIDLVEGISVEQTMNMAWEGVLKIPFHVDETGNWVEEKEKFVKSFSRVRIEINIGDSSFVPLIDGPVISIQNNMNSDPGESYLSVIVNDDSVYLNRKEEVNLFEDMTDNEIAEQLFAGSGQITSTNIDVTPASSSSLSPVIVQRETAIHLIRFLAKRNGFNAYVLPGDNPGQSIGVFKSLPTVPGDFPAFVLLGENRNIKNFQITDDAQKPSLFTVSSVSIKDKSTSSAETNFGEINLLGDSVSSGNELNTSNIFVSPFNKEFLSPDTFVKANSEKSSYSIRATGETLEGLYNKALQPYKIITVRLGNSKYSGDYLIEKVNHKLNRSDYTQSFTLLRNAVSSDAGTSVGNLLGNIF